MRAMQSSVEAIAQRFVEAFNDRDAERLLALMDPAIEFHPTGLVGQRRQYDGHEGVRQWMGELESGPNRHQARIREVHATEEGFTLLSEVLLDDELVSPSAMVARFGPDGKIVEARAFLSDEEMLLHLGLVGGSDPARPESA